MRHSIKANACPFCGSNILDNNSLKECKKISSDLISEGFNSNTSFELAIFIYNKYLKNISLEEGSAFSEDSDEDLQVESDYSKETLDEDDFDAKEDLDEDDFDEDEDRVSRLKKIARNNPILNKKGVSVRRVAD